MKIGTYSIEEYLHLIKSFHGSMAPGLIIGGFMVDWRSRTSEGGVLRRPLRDPVCLPDAFRS